MFNDAVISVDGPLNGYVVVFDMQGVALRHLTRVQFGPLRNFMAYIQVKRFLRLAFHGETKPVCVFKGSSSRTAKENLHRPHCVVRKPSLRHREALYKNRANVASTLHNRWP